MTDATLLHVDRNIATITLNRPDRRNALSIELVDSLHANLLAAISDPTVRAVVLTGAGTVFCAGADLTERRMVTAGDTGDGVPTFVRIFEVILDSPKPVIAKLNGSALAGGLGLVASCDLAIAPYSAKFGFTEVRIGVAPAVISVVCLPKMRAGDASRLFLTGERFDAQEAARVGLITTAVPDGDVDATTDALLEQLRLCGPGALVATKRVLTTVGRSVGSFSDRREAFRWTAALSAECFASAEGVEGMTAFKEKRPPSWAPAATG
jgi:methylglutaconyl-CoA hydratase